MKAFFSVVTLLLPLVLHAQTWAPFGPPGGDVDILVEDPVTGTLYLYGYTLGLHRLESGESVWEEIPTPVVIVPGLAEPISQIVAMNNRVVVVHGCCTFYRSGDGGSTWGTARQLPAPAIDGIGPIVAMRDTLYLTSYGALNLLFRSADGGASWTPADTLDAYANVVSDGETLLANREEGLYRWSGEGNWDSLRADTNALKNVMIDGDTIVILDARTNIYRSFDAGATWGKAPAKGGYGIPTLEDSIWTPYFMTLHDGRLWSAQAAGVYTMPVGGTAWALWGAVDQFGITSELLVGDERIVLTNRVGVQQWSETAGRFVPFEEGLYGHEIRQLLTIGDTLLATTPDWIYATGDEGATWERRPGPRSRPVERLTADGRFVYTFTGDTIYRTEDLGRSWNAYKAGDTQDSITPTALYVSGGAIIAGGRGILRTRNGGADWERLPTPTLHAVIAIVGSGDTLFAQTGNVEEPLILSTDFGNTWAPVVTLEPGPVITAIAFDNGLLSIGTANHGLERSSDGGATWVRTQHFDLDQPLPDTSFVAVKGLDVYGDTLFVHVAHGVDAESDILYASANGGRYWQALTRPLGNSHTIHPLGARLLAGTAEASVQATQATLGVDDRHTISAEMSIGYDAIRGILTWRCGMASTYRIDLYTLTGEYLMLIADGEDAAGTHALPLDDLPSGAYLCVLQCDGESAAVVVTAR